MLTWRDFDSLANQIARSTELHLSLSLREHWEFVCLISITKRIKRLRLTYYSDERGATISTIGRQKMGLIIHLVCSSARMRAAGEPDVETSGWSMLVSGVPAPKIRVMAVRAWSTIASSARKTPCVQRKRSDQGVKDKREWCQSWSDTMGWYETCLPDSNRKLK